jgi:hypothetical protein
MVPVGGHPVNHRCSKIVAFCGFLPTYWLKLADGTFSGTPIQHLHGAFFFAWYL